MQDFQVRNLRAHHSCYGAIDRLNFSVWRPLIPVIEAYPIAAASYTSTVKNDFVPMDVVYPHSAEESFEVRYSFSH